MSVTLAAEGGRSMVSRCKSPSPRTKLLKATLPGYLVDEVTRAAAVRSRVERVYVSPDALVERALRDYLWLEPEEMAAGGLPRPSDDEEAGATTVPIPPPVPTAAVCFGQLLRQARKHKQYPVSQLAQALHTTAHHLYEVERGRRAPLTEDRILLAAEVLEVDPEPLLLAARQ